MIFQLLAEADVNAKTNNKQTVLHIAATKDHSVIATVLLENAIDYDAVDENLDNGSIGLDLMLSGESGDQRYDDFYFSCEESLNEKTAISRFKHMSGDYATSSAFGLWLAFQILEDQKVPVSSVKRKGSLGDINKILIYNNYRGEQHGFILLSRK